MAELFSESDSDDNIDTAIIIATFCIIDASISKKVLLYSQSLPRYKYVQELLNCGYQDRIYRVLRMKLETFYILRNWCIINTNLRSFKTQNISIEEKLVMFLWTINEGASNRMVQERFSHSRETVSHCFHEVLESLLSLHKTTVQLPNASTSISSRIISDSQYSPYFINCLGALDGTHIPIYIPYQDQPQYRNRKGNISQNVLAVCNFELEFIYILTGWEGSAHNGQVLRNAQNKHGFYTLIGKYWLGDVRYSNLETILIPYRSVRYHLKEQYKSKQKPQNAKKLFNLRHASLQNCIERIFGILKRKYKILQRCEYSIDIQVRLIHILTALHNFVRFQDGSQADDLLEQEHEDNISIESIGILSNDIHISSNKTMDRFRNQLAEKMWLDYQKYL